MATRGADADDDDTKDEEADEDDANVDGADEVGDAREAMAGGSADGTVGGLSTTR